MPQFDIVVSTENNPYMAGQAMLFHYSCVCHLGQAPIVVVHKSDDALLAGFERIASTGGTIQTAVPPPVPPPPVPPPPVPPAW